MISCVVVMWRVLCEGWGRAGEYGQCEGWGLRSIAWVSRSLVATRAPALRGGSPGDENSDN